MNNLTIQSSGKEMVIRLNRDGFDEGYLALLVQRLQLEAMAQEYGFSEEILTVAEEIDQTWWDENRVDFLKDVEQP